MSLLFNLIEKLNVEEEDDDKARFFSSSPLKQTPYMILEGDKTGESCCSDAEKITMKFKLFDIYKEEMIEVIHKTFPKTLYEETRVIGSSRGWIAFMSKLDGTIHISDVFNLVRVITLPLISGIRRLPSSAITNISISSPPDHQDDDYIVFVKLLGHDLYYCRPNRVSQWTKVYLDGSHVLLSDVVYSPRNQMLFSVITGASFLLSFDHLNMNNRYTRLHLRNYPKLPLSEWGLLSSCFKTEHLAESSCGKCFIVRWYVETYDRGDQDIIYNKTKRFMVFVLDKKVKDGEINAKYTQDIGDLCIFFGNNETFCVQASEYPGLKRNTIYYIGYGIGIYDIGSGKFHHFTSSTPLNWPLCLLSNFI